MTGPTFASIRDPQAVACGVTWADASLLRALTGYAPQTPFREGVAQFVAWYREYYGV